MEREAEPDIGLSLGLGMDSERKFFHQTCEQFMSSTGTGSDLFSKFVKQNEERFLLQCSSHSSVSDFKQNGPDFVRSFSAGSGWTMAAGSGWTVPPLRTEGNLQFPVSQTSPPARLSDIDNTLFDDRFPMFVVSNRQMWAASWSEKFSLSHSSYEYRTNVSR
jgi:hypothetical protein